RDGERVPGACAPAGYRERENLGTRAGSRLPLVAAGGLGVTTTYDLTQMPLREVNQALHAPDVSGKVVITNPHGAHNVAVGIDSPIKVAIEGHCGYYAAGMNQQAEVTINGNVGTGVAENMMSGVVHVTGSASQSAGATGRGGLLVID